MKKLIVGNWKMYPKTAREAAAIFKAVYKGAHARTQVVVAAPFVYLALLRSSRTVSLGAQNIFWEPEGAFTGEVSGTMLRSLGVRYVIVGHSERRRELGETDKMIAQKVSAVLKAKLTPILCVGEEVRDADGKFFSTLKQQIRIAFSGVKRAQVAHMVVAYEPVWAVGVGKKPASPKDAAEAALFIKKVVAEFAGAKAAKRMRILYGGSVNAKDASGFLAEREISGLLVGRESRNPKEFLKIVACASPRL